MKTKLMLAFFASAAAFAYSPAFAADTAQDFVNKAAIGGMFEVESSKLIVGKSSHKNVDEFASMMIEDHGAANAKLQEVAAEQKLSLPAKLDETHQNDLKKLELSSGSLEQSYVELQRKAHSDAVTLFESYAKDGDNPSLKAFAQETVPTLTMHKQEIEKIATSMSTQSPGEVGATGATDASAPLPGANSFTEAQAISSIEEAGYSGVSGLAKDDQGIWRGKATKDGKSVSVALDYKGNVVADAK